MERLTDIQEQSLHFSRWCRKGYAIFASLGKKIRISGLALHICDMALEKTSPGRTVFVREEKENDAGGPEDAAPDLLSGMELFREVFLGMNNCVVSLTGDRRGSDCPEILCRKTEVLCH